jgi:hypothetical protein
MQKYGHMANTAVRDPFTCEVCGLSPASFNWSDYHGEGMCNQCGTPYLLIRYEGEGADKKRVEGPPTISIKPEWLPVLKRYWEETKAYMGLGTILIERDYPECVRGRKAFHAWCDAHPELLPPKAAA